jgi:hypothetical protein
MLGLRVSQFDSWPRADTQSFNDDSVEVAGDTLSNDVPERSNDCVICLYIALGKLIG